MKKLTALLLALLLVLSSVSALAATSINSGSTSSVPGELSGVKPFKFEHKKTGIGRGVCPVYSAPYNGAYRCNNGRAAVDTNSYIDLGGYSEQGWLLVRYSTNNGGTRVGWIPPKYIKGVRTSMVPHFSYIAQTAPTEINVTDNNLNPYDPTGYFATMAAGETFYIIGKYNYYQYDLWYIELTVDGQTARGFIPMDVLDGSALGDG